MLLTTISAESFARQQLITAVGDEYIVPSSQLLQPLEEDEGREELVLNVVWWYFQPKGRTLHSHFENLVKGLGTSQWSGACPVHPQENRGFYMVLTLCCSCMCWGGVGWPLRRESCFSASVLGESPGFLWGSVESWHSPAVSVVFQPKLSTGDLHGASPALGVRDVAAACHCHEHPLPVGSSPGRPVWDGTMAGFLSGWLRFLKATEGIKIICCFHFK